MGESCRKSWKWGFDGDLSSGSQTLPAGKSLLHWKFLQCQNQPARFTISDCHVWLQENILKSSKTWTRCAIPKKNQIISAVIFYFMANTTHGFRVRWPDHLCQKGIGSGLGTSPLRFRPANSHFLIFFVGQHHIFGVKCKLPWVHHSQTHLPNIPFLDPILHRPGFVHDALMITRDDDSVTKILLEMSSNAQIM